AWIPLHVSLANSYYRSEWAGDGRRARLAAMLGSTISRWARRLVAAVLVSALAVGASVPVAAQELEIPPDPEEVLNLVLHVLDAIVPDDLPDPLALLDPINPSCDDLDPGQCLFPFPSDHWTVADASTATGRRV